MKKVIVLVFIVIIGALLGIQKFQEHINSILSEKVSISTSVSPTATTIHFPKGKETKSLFVPYWTLSSNDINSQDFDQLIYFGITPKAEKVDKEEQGYKNLETFIAHAKGKQKLLCLRMLNADNNAYILSKKNNQESLILDTITSATVYDFDGVVLDLEVKALPFDSLTKEITDFVVLFDQKAKQAHLTFSMTIYGDTFYRVRPFDIKAISTHVDQLMIMAYDFSKAKSNPGPNFPLYGKETYGYDFQKMVDDFTTFVPREKLTVVFGMFGYDWIVDKNNISLTQGKARTLQDIQASFFPVCQLTNCLVKRDSKTSETKITYEDNAGENHIIWFEDNASVKEKEQYLHEKGVYKSSFWAYSYF